MADENEKMEDSTDKEPGFVRKLIDGASETMDDNPKKTALAFGMVAPVLGEKVAKPLIEKGVDLVRSIGSGFSGRDAGQMVAEQASDGAKAACRRSRVRVSVMK